MKKYKKVFQFGKVAANSAHETNLVEIEATLKIEDDKQIVFAASGGVWNASHTDYIECGQCIDSVYNEYKSQLQNRKLYEKIMTLWEKWHLNDMHAGCEHQRKLENELYEKHEKAYCKKCSYKYGSAWKYQKIDKNDLREIMQILEIAPLDQLQISRL